MIVTSLLFGDESQLIAATQTGTVTATTLYVRKGAGTNYAVMEISGKKVYLKKGDTVKVLAQKNGFYQVSFTYNKKNRKGYVSKSYIKLKSSSAKTGSNIQTSITGISIPAKIRATSLRVRKSSSTASAQVTSKGSKVSLKKNTNIKIIGMKLVSGRVWYRISASYNKAQIKGYVLGDYIKLTLKKNVKAVINSNQVVKIRKKAGVKSAYLTQKGKIIGLNNKKSVTIVKETIANSKRWYQIKFTFNNKSMSGYVLANQVMFKKSTTVTPTATPKPTAAPTVKPTAKPTVTPGNRTGVVTATALNVRTGAGTNYDKLTYNGSTVQLSCGDKVVILSEKQVGSVLWYYVSFDHNSKTLKGYVSGEYIVVNTDSSGGGLTEKEFETMLTKQKFPESYKASLRAIHKAYPNWQFTAYHTGIDWNTAISKETRLGINAITNAKADPWLSFATGAYNYWASGSKFTIVDGSTWVNPSQQAVEYYMDPRNFLNSSSIFQFQKLSYNSQYQNEAGVETILKNTPFYNKSYSYKDSSTGKTIKTTYAKTFIAAAKASGVNPYHLATRVKQEVVRSATTTSIAVTGTVSGYEGIYNFYNIGATHGSNPALNGLKYAKNTTNSTYLLPWDNQYKAIVGGAKYIGNNYINKGQDTVYLQKFNMSSYNTFSHQYMANIEAPNAEASKTFNVYNSYTDVPLEFSIPVYENMPSSACSVPTKSSNNWLKALKVDGYSLSPSLNTNSQSFTIKVDKDAASVKISATAVDTAATISGVGTKKLGSGTTTATITVKAANGEQRKYTIKFVKS